MNSIDFVVALPTKPDTFGERQMTHEQYVDLIRARILTNQALRQRLAYIDDTQSATRNSLKKMMAHSALKREVLNYLITEDLALLAEVTSADRI